MNAILNLFPAEIASSIGWTLLHSLWQGGLIAVGLYFILYFLHAKSANIKAFLSFAALLLLFLSAAATYVIEYNSALPAGSGAVAALQVNSADLSLNSADVKNLTDNTGMFSQIYTSFQHIFRENINIIVTFWFAGFLFFALRFTGGLVYTARIKRKIILIDEEIWDETLNCLTRKINLKKKITLAESAIVKVPIVLGYFKPMILLPLGLVSGLPVSQVEAIIAHEIAHIKRYDILINLFQSVAEIFFFFNPFVWYISNKIKAERENSCDDIAIGLCGDEVVYAKALANAEIFKESNEPLFAIPLFKNQNQLYRRIKRMLHKDENRNGFKEKFAAALIFMGILIAAAVLKNTGAVNTDDGVKTNKAGFTFPSSIFVGDKELTGIEVDTTKAVKGTRSFSYFQKEDGKMKRYRARMKDGKLAGLSIDGEKVPQEKLDGYRKDVEDAFAKLDDEGYFFPEKLFDGNEFFNSKEFKEQMDKLQKELQANEGKLKEHFNSEEFKNEMAKVQKEIQQHSKELNSRFKSEEFKKQMEMARKQIHDATKHLRDSDFYNEGKFDRKKFKEEMDRVGKELENLPDLKNLEALKGLEKLKLDSLVNLSHLKALENIKMNDLAMKGLDKSMEEFNLKMKDFNANMKVFKEKMRVFGKFIKEVKGMLVDEKLIDKDDDHVNLNIKKDGVYIDGKKQSDAVFEKVKSIYKKYYNKEYDGDFNLNFEN